MTHPEPTIRVNVDLTNPGQFFACCGLLELADRLCPGAEGWFEDGQFNIVGDVANTVPVFLAASIASAQSMPASQSQSNDDEDKKSSIMIGPPFNLLLDWWRDDNPDQSAIESKLKTWSAGQKVSNVFDNTSETKKQKTTYHGHCGWMSQVIRDNPNDWLRTAIPISKPKAFCYDSRLSRNNALDQGHTSGGIMAFSPAVDVLALIGLQRFRPRTVNIWQRNEYCTWSIPLPVSVAPVAALGLIPHFIVNRYQFPMIRRDSAGKYKLVGHAQPVRSIQ